MFKPFDVAFAGNQVFTRNVIDGYSVYVGLCPIFQACSKSTLGISIIQEHDDVILTCLLPQYGLDLGDLETVVLVHQSGRGYEVEFITLHGDPVAVVILEVSQVRPIQAGEIAHARDLAKVSCGH